MKNSSCLLNWTVKRIFSTFCFKIHWRMFTSLSPLNIIERSKWIIQDIFILSISWLCDCICGRWWQMKCHFPIPDLKLKILWVMVLLDHINDVTTKFLSKMAWTSKLLEAIRLSLVLSLLICGFALPAVNP